MNSRTRGLSRLADLKGIHEWTERDMEEQRQRFERLADPGSAARVVTSHNLYQTPEPLAARLASLFPTFGRTLEPSAGLGRLYHAVRAVSPCHVTLVDISPDCCRELDIIRDAETAVVQGDFLTMTPDRLGFFDSVIMNPPFSAEMKHVRHAWQFLKEGGKLVAIMSEGPFFRERDKAFREWLDEIGAESEKLPAGSFKPSGTDVNARIVWATK